MNKQPITLGWSIGLVGLWAAICCVVYLLYVGWEGQAQEAQEFQREAVADEQFKAELLDFRERLNYLNTKLNSAHKEIVLLKSIVTKQQESIVALVDVVRG